jgi:hypothetical protein
MFLMDDFGAMTSLKQIIEMKVRTEAKLGYKVDDSTDNQLKDWI